MIRQHSGFQVQFLPRELWALGLGHLGNAYLWSLATLPYADPGAVEISLNDFDRIESENADTSLLFDADDEGTTKRAYVADGLKTRISDQTDRAPLRFQFPLQRRGAEAGALRFRFE